MSSYPEDDHHYSGCFGRSRRSTPSGHTHRGFFNFGQSGRTVLPPLSSAFRSSRPIVPDHSSSHTHQDIPEGRNEYNAPSNDPTTWPGYNPIGQQSSFAYGDDPRQPQYSYPAPQQIPYSSYPSSRDPASSYPINPTDSRILPPINVGERWQQGAYPSNVARPSEPIYSPVATYPSSSYPQFSSNQPTSSHHTVPAPDLRSLSIPISSAAPSSGIHRRTSLSVDRNSTGRSSSHATSPYARHPPQSDITPEPPQVKKKRKRADAEQLKVLNEVYARTAFPSTEERQELATRLNMTPRSVQIWFQNKRQSMRNTHRHSHSHSVRGTGTDSPSTASSHQPPATQPTSRSSQGQGNVLSIPAAPSRAGSTVSPQSTYIPPSPTDPSYYGGRPVQMHQGQTSTSHHRPPSRSRESYDDYYEGSRRSRG